MEICFEKCFANCELRPLRNSNHIFAQDGAMMLLDENLATLIHHTIANFNTHPDKLALSRITDSLSALEQARELRMREGYSSLRKLARTLTALTSNHNQSISSHDENDHGVQILELDSEKFRVAKAASELEIEAQRLEGDLQVLKERLEELDSQGVEGDQGERVIRELEDPVILKLRIYRMLGINVEADKAGNFTKVAIRSASKGDVHIVNIDPNFPPMFYTDYFWKMVQGGVF